MTEPTDAQALEDFIIELAAGTRRSELHANPLMPTRWQVQRASRTDEKFAERLRDAEMIGLQVSADELLDIADDSSLDWVETENGPRINREAIQRSELRIKTRQWLLERLQRERYGNKLDVSGEVYNYVVELPPTIVDKDAWLKQYGQQSQPAIASLSGALTPDPKPH